MRVASIRKVDGNPTFKETKCWHDSNLDPNIVNFDDKSVYENVYHQATTRNAGVFQLTSGGAQKLFERAKPNSIVDIAALTSIYRPGPLAAGVDKIYVEAKANPDMVRYEHPLVKKVLESTYNCIIFQESLMELCHVVAGFPKSECDKVRKNVLKRQAGNKEEAAKKAKAMRDGFVEGAVKNGVAEKVADELWNKILFFSGYGFNASHAVSYAIDSYYCAWLLTYYEPEWLCAYMESKIGNPESRGEGIAQIKSFGYKIGSIDINESGRQWSVSRERKEFIPSFSSAKSLGDAAVDEILSLRPYSDIQSMLYNEDGSWRHSKFNRRALEALIKLCAFGSMDIVGPGKIFSSYRHMHHCVIENNDLIKKTSKKNQYVGWENLQRIAAETWGMHEWSRKELAMFSLEIIGSVDPELMIEPNVYARIQHSDVKSIDEWTHQDVYWFIAVESIQKKTKKGKDYLQLKAWGAKGEERRIFVWDWDGKTHLGEYAVCVGEIDKGGFGLSTKMKKIKVLSSNLS